MKFNSEMIRATGILLAAIPLLLQLTGCATRTDVNNIITDLDRLQESYADLERKNAAADSLLREQMKLIRDLSANLDYSMDMLGERMQLIEDKLEDYTGRRLDGQYYINREENISETDTSGAGPEKKKVEISSKQIYDTAYMDYIKGDFKLAAAGFREYLKNESQSPLSDNAQYLIGECYFNSKTYGDAAEAYTALLKQYPKSEKVPAALLRLTEISLKRKDKSTANRYYEKLKSSFPERPETERARELIKSYGKK
jgi:tol-pal system protein YbgF